SSDLGQKTYNGVAILARERALDNVQMGIPGFDDDQKRVIAATVDGVRVVNLYVVNGQDVGTEKYAYKLRWLDAVHDWLAAEIAAHPRLVVLGDFNIAPDDRDVHDPAIWNDTHILTSTAARDALRRLQAPAPHAAFRLHPAQPGSHRRTRRAAPAAGAGPARRLPPAPRPGRRLQLVGLPPGRLPPRPGPAHRPDPGLRRPARAGRRSRHRPRTPHVGTPQRPRPGVG